MCREIFEEIIGLPFPKKRLKCMEKLELDGFCDDVGVAFEYNGLKHDEYIPQFHRNGVEDFWKQQVRDNRKKELCEKNCFYLIEIPSTYNYIKPRALRRYIETELKQNRLI